MTGADVAPWIVAHGLLLGLFLFSNVVRGWIGVR